MIVVFFMCLTSLFLSHIFFVCFLLLLRRLLYITAVADFSWLKVSSSRITLVKLVFFVQLFFVHFIIFFCLWDFFCWVYLIFLSSFEERAETDIIPFVNFFHLRLVLQTLIVSVHSRKRLNFRRSE